MRKNCRRTHLDKSEWKKYALFDPSKPYTRNLIATDDETYTLLLLYWNPMQESPIHDHPCDGCWMKVLEGGVRECRYDTKLNCISDAVFHQGDLTYMTDSIGYHKVGNPTNQQAMSLHLYSPPFSRCRVWRDETQETAKQCDLQNHSEYGRVLGK
jgi:cysteine dioxygenase